MVPDFSFVALDEMGDEWLIRRKLGFRKAENIGSNVLHLKKNIKHIRSFIFESYSVDVLKVYSEDLFSPDFLGYVALAGVYGLVHFALVC